MGIVGSGSWVDLEKAGFSVLVLVADLEFTVGSRCSTAAAGKNISEVRIHVPA